MSLLSLLPIVSLIEIILLIFSQYYIQLPEIKKKKGREK